MHRYTILGQLGDGSFGVVSKAMHTTTGEIVAVKKMKQRFSSWEECLQLREIQSLRRLQHHNIIKLKEVVRENTELFLIFEFMELNVYQITRLRSDQMGSVQNIFNDKEVRSIVCQTLLGLSAIHKGGFMHRDLKPENLLTKGDLVKIADFGLAKEIRSRPPFTEYVSTRWYRAPEIILRSTHYNSPIDIWATGVIFAELYLNRPLFPGSSDPDQLFKICSILGPPNPNDWDEGYQLARRLNIRFPPMAPTPLRQIIPNAPPAAIDLIEQMLRFNPSDRPTAAMCLQHPFFTGANSGQEHNYGGHTSTMHGGAMAATSSLFAGIASGQPHNPYQLAAGPSAPGGSLSLPGPGPQTPLGSSTPNLPTPGGSSLGMHGNLQLQGMSGVTSHSSGGPAFMQNNQRSGFPPSPTPQGQYGLPNQQHRVGVGSGMVSAAIGGVGNVPGYSPPSPTQPAPFAFGGGGMQPFGNLRPSVQMQPPPASVNRSNAAGAYDEFQY